MSAVKVAKAGETVVIWQETEGTYDSVILTRLQVANLVVELDAWLSGTDRLPEGVGG